MRRNSKHSFRFILTTIAVTLSLAVSVRVAIAQDKAVRSSYEVLSSTPTEILLHIHPDFKQQLVTDPVTGESYTSVTFTGGIANGIVKGAPAESYLQLPLLVASKTSPAIVSIVSKETRVISGVIAPVGTPKSRNGSVETQYIRDAEAYGNHTPALILSQTPVSIFRAAYESDVIVHPVQYDLTAGSITLITDMVIKIVLPGEKSTASPVSQKEASFFHALFINGDNASLYNSASSEVTNVALRSIAAFKNSPQSAEQWFEITTSDEGMYHITSGDLTKAGVSSIDPSTISIYGYGAQTLPEKVDSLTGELRECSIDVRTKGDGS
ncbi:MAG TPA: hypothetical protein VFO76_13050, partial [Candidatus Kapabacteria bacterium]|nr:hypothetical protein [Candidatus Kapabacteria bacterium]